MTGTGSEVKIGNIDLSGCAAGKRQNYEEEKRPFEGQTYTPPRQFNSTRISILASWAANTIHPNRLRF
jgi:hypothetical protein